jgi:excinuclease UvrABC nuclease subunit
MIYKLFLEAFVLDLSKWKTVSNRLQIPHNTKGVYLIKLKDTGEIIYVGKSKDIRSRLGDRNHCYNRLDPNMRIYFLDDSCLENESIRYAVEEFLITAFMPVKNIRLKPVKRKKGLLPVIASYPLPKPLQEKYIQQTLERQSA